MASIANELLAENMLQEMYKASTIGDCYFPTDRKFAEIAITYFEEVEKGFNQTPEFLFVRHIENHLKDNPCAVPICKICGESIHRIAVNERKQVKSVMTVAAEAIQGKTSTEIVGILEKICYSTMKQTIQKLRAAGFVRANEIYEAEDIAKKGEPWKLAKVES